MGGTPSAFPPGTCRIDPIWDQTTLSQESPKTIRIVIYITIHKSSKFTGVCTNKNNFMVGRCHHSMRNCIIGTFLTLRTTVIEGRPPPSRPWEEHRVHSRALLEPSWLCLWSRVFHEPLSEQMRLWSPSFAYKVNCPSHWQGMLAGEQREALVASLEHPQRLEAQERQPPLCPPALEGPRAIGRGVHAVTPTQTFLETLW